MPGRAPNLVYILADDMGYGDLSCLNPESKIQTEHLDRLAAGGLCCTDAHATSAVCTPSRYSILTGRYNWRSTLKAGVNWGYSPRLIEPGRTTVASFLKQRGYSTMCVGKWHLGWTWPRRAEAAADEQGDDIDTFDVDYTQPITDGPTTVGFDRFFGISASLDMPPYVYVEDDRVTAVPNRNIEATEGMQFWRGGPIAPDFAHGEVLPTLVEKAVGFIDEKASGDSPFFLYLPLPAPHTPILPTAPFQGRSGTNAYGDFCLQVDDVVGQVMAALERNGITDDTILVFTADNGCSPMADFDELAGFGHRPSHVFRGHKADIYEGGHRIPLIVSWPEEITAGAEHCETVCLVDLLATMTDIHDTPLPDGAGEDSVSNLPIWRGGAIDGSLRQATVHHSVDGSFSIRAGRWKLEMCPGSGGWSFPRPGKESEGLPPIQLYDLEADIGERRNVQHDHADVVEQLTDLLTRYVLEGRSTPGTPQANSGAELWEQLWWMQDDDEDDDANS
ncbi:MAG: arylsulfatase [Candidatus Latescibacteria bacterium]|jgi:arylsulfatase A-like enzyme|nr:arylsulfatase [Gemmatimonadaceae bacterium]MDP6015008.1 arylsulfatase [Candidatus Latescibacterota bacterium]MDP7449923.1 arylsulfatase [Candidatus Latescibacterota bacterium]HJP29079.1 arylsulfatase [Candidatus Latescibacterota bacterium]